MSDLNSEFKAFEKAVKENKEKLAELVAQAQSFLDKAQKLSEETGVPFEFDFYGVRGYIPKSMNEKFFNSKEDEDYDEYSDEYEERVETIYELTGVSYAQYDSQESGWQYSSYC